MNASGATLLHAFILAQLAFFNGLLDTMKESRVSRKTKLSGCVYPRLTAPSRRPRVAPPILRDTHPIPTNSFGESSECPRHKRSPVQHPPSGTPCPWYLDSQPIILCGSPSRPAPNTEALNPRLSDTRGLDRHRRTHHQSSFGSRPPSSPVRSARWWEKIREFFAPPIFLSSMFLSFDLSA